MDVTCFLFAPVTSTSTCFHVPPVFVSRKGEIACERATWEGFKYGTAGSRDEYARYDDRVGLTLNFQLICNSFCLDGLFRHLTQRPVYSIAQGAVNRWVGVRYIF